MTAYFVPIRDASRLSGLDARLIRNLTMFDPRPEVADSPPIRSMTSGRSGRTLVDLAAVQTIAGALLDSGLMAMHGRSKP